MDEAWDLRRAVSAVGLLVTLLESASGSEERQLDEELQRLGICGIDEEATMWDGFDLETEHQVVAADSPPGGELPKEGFVVGGIAGCIHSVRQRWVGSDYRFRFANSTWNLFESDGLSGHSLNALVKAAWVAGIMLDIENSDAGTKALGYRELTRLGVRTFAMDDENPRKHLKPSS